LDDSSRPDKEQGEGKGKVNPWEPVVPGLLVETLHRFILKGLTAIEYGSTALSCGNSELIRVSLDSEMEKEGV